ncbi:MAG: hypothetical protein WC378_13745 [Opitutaceae bacterium]|jgi:signal transduction histidine kinase
MLSIAVTTLEKLKQVPRQFWLNVAIAILSVVALVVVIRRIRQMNKIVLLIIVAFVAAIVSANWVYQRNEPKFLTPFVDALANFLPTKGKK